MRSERHRITIELTVGAIEDIIADAVLILSTNLGYVAPHTVDIVEQFITLVMFVFLATQFA